MRFCVCIKQVPDISAAVQTGRMVLNAYDASAVEEALVLTGKHGGSVDLLLLGPDSAKETIRKALAMGADSATHLVSGGDDLDSFAVASLLAARLEGHDFDVIAVGKQSQDTDAGLAGSMLAERLGLPYASNAVGMEADPEARKLLVTRQGDSGQEIIELPMPCIVTCSNDMNNPRIPSLRGIMDAKKKTVNDAAAGNLPAGRPVTRVVAHEAPPGREPGQLFQGDVDELVQTLVDRLANEAKVL